MCGGYYTRPDTAEEYREENPDYQYTAFKNEQGKVAYLIFDKDDPNSCSQFDAVLPDGTTFGWDCEDATRELLAEEGFTEAPVTEEEAVDAV